MRTRYANDAAEKLAVVADHLEEQASRVRLMNPDVAFQMKKEASRLRRAARNVQNQAARAKRAREQRKIEQEWKELDRLNGF